MVQDVIESLMIFGVVGGVLLASGILFVVYLNKK